MIRLIGVRWKCSNALSRDVLIRRRTCFFVGNMRIRFRFYKFLENLLKAYGIDFSQNLLAQQCCVSKIAKSCVINRNITIIFCC